MCYFGLILAGRVIVANSGYLVKIECLVADVTAVGSHDRAKRAILGVFVAGRVFGQSRSFLWSGSHFVM